MVQENDSLEVNLDTHLDDSASSSNDDHVMDAHALNEELSMLCENLLEKYKLLKKMSLKMKKENEFLSSRLDCVLKEKEEISNENDSLTSNFDLA